MKGSLTVAIGIATLATFACKKPVDTVANAPATSATQSGGTQASTAAPAIPANLQNDAYHYYGLSRTAPATYVVTIDNGSPQTGSESVKFKGMDGGHANFDIERTGALEQLGSEQVALDDKGVTVMSTTPGKLEGNPLDMPASLAPGTTWKTDYKVTIAPAAPTTGTDSVKPTPTVTEDHSTFKVVGPQKVTTKAGTFDAILVESDGKDSLNSQNFNLKTQSWYVKDRGPVKIVVTTLMGTKTTALTIEAVPGDPK